MSIPGQRLSRVLLQVTPVAGINLEHLAATGRTRKGGSEPWREKLGEKNNHFSRYIVFISTTIKFVLKTEAKDLFPL